MRNIAFLTPHSHPAGLYLGKVQRTGTLWEDAQCVGVIVDRQHPYPTPLPPSSVVAQVEQWTLPLISCDLGHHPFGPHLLDQDLEPERGSGSLSLDLPCSKSWSLNRQVLLLLTHPSLSPDIQFE